MGGVLHHLRLELMGNVKSLLCHYFQFHLHVISMKVVASDGIPQVMAFLLIRSSLFDPLCDQRPEKELSTYVYGMEGHFVLRSMIIDIQTSFRFWIVSRYCLCRCIEKLLSIMMNDHCCLMHFSIFYKKLMLCIFFCLEEPSVLQSVIIALRTLFSILNVFLFIFLGFEGYCLFW